VNFFASGYDFRAAVQRTVERGFDFVDGAISEEGLTALEQEGLSLPLEVGDHITYPIQPGTKREVRQLHARSYHLIASGEVPVAHALTEYLTQQAAFHPTLVGWASTEAGYQFYRGPTDFISPHRDRMTDRLLSATVTIRGKAWVRILEPINDPNDYTNLRVVHEHLTSDGTLMLLRAPGLGNGNQVIHEVKSPLDTRLILNLRCRPNVLPQPKAY
jgi:hypothetical protein